VKLRCSTYVWDSEVAVLYTTGAQRKRLPPIQIGRLRSRARRGRPSRKAGFVNLDNTDYRLPSKSTTLSRIAKRQLPRTQLAAVLAPEHGTT